MAQEVRQQAAGRGGGGAVDPVDAQRDLGRLLGHGGGAVGHAQAFLAAPACGAPSVSVQVAGGGGRGRGQRPGGQDAHEHLAVGDGGVDVRVGVDVLAGRLGGLGPVDVAHRAAREGLGEVQDVRGGGDGDEGQPHAGDDTVDGRDRGGDTGQGVVAVPAGELHEGRARAGRQPPERRAHGHLVLGEARLERADEEVGGGDLAGPAGAGDLDVAVQQREHRRHLAGGVGVGDRADRGAAVADDRVGDVQQGLAQQREGGVGALVPLQLGVPDEGADAHRVLPHLDVAEAGHPVDVDQVGRRGEAHVEDRDEALAAGEDLAVVAHLSEDGDGLIDAARCVVHEGRGLHRADPAFPKGGWIGAVSPPWAWVVGKSCRQPPGNSTWAVRGCSHGPREAGQGCPCDVRSPGCCARRRALGARRGAARAVRRRPRVRRRAPRSRRR